MITYMHKYKLITCEKITQSFWGEGVPNENNKLKNIPSLIENNSAIKDPRKIIFRCFYGSKSSGQVAVPLS